MNLLLVSQYFWPESFQINPIVARLAKLGHRVEVLTGQPNYPHGHVYPGYKAVRWQRELYAGAAINRVPLAPRASGALRLALNYLSFVLSGTLFGPWILRKRPFDVIFVYAPSPLLQALPALFLGWMRRRPVVLWVQDLWPESLSATGHVRNRFVLWLVEQAVRFIYRKTALVLVQSEAFMEPVRRLAPHTALAYLPNSVDDNFARQDNPVESSDKTDKFVVLFAGNLGTAQAVECILSTAETLRDHTDIQLILVGDGSRRPWLLEEVKRKELGNISLPGRFPMEAMPTMMRQASALLVTLAAQEIFAYTVPSKMQAYMASGRPIIAALNGEGARLIRESGAGLAVPAEDAQALAQTILRLRDMPVAEREAMGKAGHAYYDAHFREDMLVDRLLAHLDQVASTIRDDK
jgi:glycosyltransferase involved in cell wall biosynthesis